LLTYHVIWEDTAANRSEWRSRVAEGAVDYEEDCLTRAENKRRQDILCQQLITQSHICTICGKSFQAATGLFSRNRTHRGSADFTTNTWPWGKCRGHHPIGWTNEPC